MPPLYWNVTFCFLSPRSSTNTTSRLLFKNAIVCRRSVTVRATNSTPSAWKISGSGQKRIEVPRAFLSGDAPTFCNLPFGLPPSTNSCRKCVPSRCTSATTRTDNAFTTLTPTPCRPPDTLYPSPPNFPPACSTVSTTSSALLPLCGPDGYGSTGMPRPLSTTSHEPSGCNVTMILLQKPAIASSTELSTTSQMRWCKPARPVEPMYMPGRRRTGSRPSSTWMSLAP